MASIILSGKRQIPVSVDEAERIEREWMTGEKKIRINDETTVKNGDIKEVQKTAAAAKTYDLKNELDREEVKKFERFLEDLKGEIQKLQPIEYYGYPMKKLDGWVLNQLLGGVHWTVVAYALRERIISRRDVGGMIYWAIVNQSPFDRSTDISPYLELRAKLQALSDLRSRRQYAQDKENEGLAAQVDGEIQKLKATGLFGEA